MPDSDVNAVKPLLHHLSIRRPATVVNDTRLSWAAVGIALFLYYRNTGMPIRDEDITPRCATGPQTVEGCLRELRNAGYLREEL